MERCFWSRVHGTLGLMKTMASRLLFRLASWAALRATVTGRVGAVSISFVALLGFLGGLNPAFAATGLFTKMPAAKTVNVVDCSTDSTDARMTAWALEGLINQTKAESYVITRPEDEEQLDTSGKPSNRLPLLDGADPGLRALFGKYSSRVKKMIVYDPKKDWTFYLALMASAQGGGIPVTESIRARLSSEFGWTGPVEDFRNHGDNRVTAYDWALANLMPGCSRKVVFVLNWRMPLVDYAVASRGFIFWLDFSKSDELAEAQKIFATHGYTVGTSLMGYASDGDDANRYANPYGIGYVVSDLYANGSFWSSFPDKTYHQDMGTARKALPGKIYVALGWSDGDNIQFDQRLTYRLWQGSSRGTVPISTTLSPTLQELNPPLLDWYYSKMTANDELISGPSGVQFIFGDDYNPDLFPAWCSLSGVWVADAGFHTAYFWRTRYPSEKYAACMKTFQLAGIFHAFSNHFNNQVKYDMGTPVVEPVLPVRSEQALFDSLANLTPRADGPVFAVRDCGVQGFGDDGYAKVEDAVNRLNAAYPGRFVFMLSKDFFATIRSYYHLAPAPEQRREHS